MLPTCLVGSYPQPEWLIDRARLSKQVPRVRARDLWLIAPDKLEAAQDDATLLAIRDQERAGIDIVSDGEQRRESYSNHFATALDGVDIDNPGTTTTPIGSPTQAPRITRPIRRQRPVAVRDVQWLRANTDRRIKATVPDRKSTRLNSSHGYISYAVFCLKKKNGEKSSVLDEMKDQSKLIGN